MHVILCLADTTRILQAGLGTVEVGTVDAGAPTAMDTEVFQPFLQCTHIIPSMQITACMLVLHDCVPCLRAPCSLV